MPYPFTAPPCRSGICRRYQWITPGAWTLTRAGWPVTTYCFHEFQHRGFVLLELLRPVGFAHTVLTVPFPGGHAATLHILNVHLLPEEGAFIDSFTVTGPGSLPARPRQRSVALTP